jgi:hypothetical protein
MSSHGLAYASTRRLLSALTIAAAGRQLSLSAPLEAQLVKADGKWLISKRYISSDSGLPDRFDQLQATPQSARACLIIGRTICGLA